MTESDLSADQVAGITAFVDIEAPPPPGLATAHIIFGTNQAEPALIAGRRYRDGLHR